MNHDTNIVERVFGRSRGFLPVIHPVFEATVRASIQAAVGGGRVACILAVDVVDSAVLTSRPLGRWPLLRHSRTSRYLRAGMNAARSLRVATSVRHRSLLVVVRR